MRSPHQRRLCYIAAWLRTEPRGSADDVNDEHMSRRISDGTHTQEPSIIIGARKPSYALKHTSAVSNTIVATCYARSRPCQSATWSSHNQIACRSVEQSQPSTSMVGFLSTSIAVYHTGHLATEKAVRNMFACQCGHMYRLVA
jgi:hypothetical protein